MMDSCCQTRKTVEVYHSHVLRFVGKSSRKVSPAHNGEFGGCIQYAYCTYAFGGPLWLGLTSKWNLGEKL